MSLASYNVARPHRINTLRPEQNSWHLADDIFKIISLKGEFYIDGLMQERRNPSALAMELSLSCSNPTICWFKFCRSYSSLANWLRIILGSGNGLLYEGKKIHQLSIYENHWTCRTFPMAGPKCLMRDFTNLNGIYKAHQKNVWWTMKFFGYAVTAEPMISIIRISDTSGPFY